MDAEIGTIRGDAGAFGAPSYSRRAAQHLQRERTRAAPAPGGSARYRAQKQFGSAAAQMSITTPGGQDAARLTT